MALGSGLVRIICGMEQELYSKFMNSRGTTAITSTSCNNCTIISVSFNFWTTGLGNSGSRHGRRRDVKAYCKMIGGMVEEGERKAEEDGEGALLEVLRT
jgi:hypothetical protein